MAALEAMAHFGIGDWESEAMKMMAMPDRLEWVVSLLVSTCGYRLKNAPNPDIWYPALVPSLKLACELGQKRTLDTVARMAMACSCYRIEDLLPFAEGEAHVALLTVLCTKRVPVEHCSVFFGCISESLQGFWDSSARWQFEEAVSRLYDAMFVIRMLLDNTPECKSQARALYSRQLKSARREFGLNLPSDEHAVGYLDDTLKTLRGR